MAPSESRNASRIANDVVPVANRPDRLDLDEFEVMFDEEKSTLESWKEDHAPAFVGNSLPFVLWNEAESLRHKGEYNKLESEDVVVEAIQKEVDHAFKGNLKTEEKKVLKRE